VVDQLVGEDFAGGDVVAVTESPRDRQDLVLPEELRLFDQAVDVDAIRRCTRLLPGELGLGVAVGPGGS